MSATVPPAAQPSREQQIRDAANQVAAAENCDVLQINHDIDPGLERKIQRRHYEMRRRRVDKLYLILTTSGGQADVAYKCMRFLQTVYHQKIVVAVPGWCKSAGTLMAIGAQELHFGPFGELGPLDVQLLRPDAMGEASSGLAIDTAVEKLQHEAFKLLIGFVREAKDTEFRFSLKTATDIATKATIGLFQPIFEKLDPIQIGEEYRSFRIAEAYAERLDSKGQNLRREPEVDGLRALLEAYPSHGFVIDHEEARGLFRNVKIAASNLQKVMALLGAEALYPLDRTSGKDVVKYLNTDDPQNAQNTATASKGGSDAGGSQGVSGPVAGGVVPADDQPNPQAGTGEKPEPKASKARKPRTRA